VTRRALAWLTLLTLASGARAAEATTRRLAVVVGNDTGVGQRPLRFAETDAGKMARTLIEVGDVAPADVRLLQGRSRADVDAALQWVTAQVARAHARAEARVLVIFYFSGHSDGAALELGGDRLSYASLRAALTATGAEVRLAIIDACRSGGFLAVKGGTPGPAFQIRLTDALDASGEVFLTSSAADEVALESPALGGSYFTENLITGLRGAADTSGDGRVTLAEAYAYTFKHTVSATADTDLGPQHPAYDVKLSGQGELVLSTLRRAAVTVRLPAGFDRLRITDLLRDEVVAELPAGAARTVALAAGSYGVKAWRAGRPFAGRFTLRQGQVLAVGWDLLAPAPASPALRPKGSPSAQPRAANLGAPASRAPRLQLAVGLGMAGGVAQDQGPLGLASATLRGVGAAGPTVSVQASTGRGAGFRETAALLLAGYRLGAALGPVHLWIAAELGGGAVFQARDGHGVSSSWLGALGPAAGATWHLGGPVALALDLRLPVCLLQIDGAKGVRALPAGTLGLAVAL